MLPLRLPDRLAAVLAELLDLLALALFLLENFLGGRLGTFGNGDFVSFQPPTACESENATDLLFHFSI
jgi:hypothetical protein